MDVELLKFGETLTGNPEPSRPAPARPAEGVETRRAAPKAPRRHGEGIVQTPNRPTGQAAKAVAGTKICRGKPHAGSSPAARTIFDNPAALGVDAMSTELVKKEIERFLASSAIEAICIRGKWGVGKTFTWMSYLAGAKAAGKIALGKYAYVSLFGLNSLEEVRYSIFENTIKRDAIGSSASFETMAATIETFARRNAKTLKFAANLIPFSGAKDIASQIFPYFMGIREQLICIDDFERRGNNLAVGDVLGLLSFLKEQRGCKIVLLLNDDALDGDDKETFESYLDKVVDASLRFEPTPSEAVEIALNGTDYLSMTTAERCSTLGISNIRAIRRIDRLVRSAVAILESWQIDQKVIAQCVQSVVLLAWCVFEPDIAPKLEYLSNRRKSYFGSRKDKEVTPEEASWDALLELYGFSYLDEFDLALLAGIKSGFFDPSKMEAPARALDDQAKAGGAETSMRDAWSVYHNTFEDNSAEIIEKIYSATMAHLNYLTPLNLNGTVGLLKALDRGDLAATLIAAYVAQSDKPRSLFDLEDYPFSGDITDTDVLAAFAGKLANSPESRNPKETLLRISDSWSNEDIEYLSKLDVQTYYNLFKSTNGPELRKLVGNALRFSPISNATDQMREVTNRARAALLRIGKESKINARRVQRYGVVVDDDDLATAVIQADGDAR